MKTASLVLATAAQNFSQTVCKVILGCTLFLSSEFAQESQASPTLTVPEPTEAKVVTASEEAPQIAAVRVANMLPSVPLVDLVVDGRLKVPDIAYGNVSEYFVVPVEGAKLALMPHVAIAADGKVLEGNRAPDAIPFDVVLEADTYYTIVLSYIGDSTQEDGEQTFISPLVSIFENPLEPPPPGRARVSVINVSGQPISVDIFELKDKEAIKVVNGLEVTAVRIQAVLAPSGYYKLSFGPNETELEVTLQAGTYYKFYVFRDGDQLVVDVDVDAIIATFTQEDGQ